MYQTETDLSNSTLRNWLVSMFPAIMNQEDESNNQKILNLIADLLNEHKNDLLSISDQFLLNNASGQTLTDIALDYGINRIDEDDDFLPFQVRVQLLENHIGITTNDLKTLIATILNIGTDMFDIIGTGNPEELKVVNIPFDFNSGDKAEIKQKILTNAIQSMLPPEYSLNDLQYATTVINQLYVGVYAQAYPQITVKEMV